MFYLSVSEKEASKHISKSIHGVFELELDKHSGSLGSRDLFLILMIPLMLTTGRDLQQTDV